jgi:hypothetical protein
VLHRRLLRAQRPTLIGSHLRSASKATSQRQTAVKLHGVFLSRWRSLDCSSSLWVHRVLGGDSGVLVDPFMHVVTYTTRHLATLRESELLPSFSGPSPG